MQRWLWASFISAVLVAATAIVLLPAINSSVDPKINESNFRKIKKGMRYANVVAILGEPSCTFRDLNLWGRPSGPILGALWASRQHSGGELVYWYRIWVQLGPDGKVIATDKEHDRTLLTDWRDWIHEYRLW